MTNKEEYSDEEMKPEIVRNTRSLDKYEIDPILKRFFRQYLQGGKIPGLGPYNREVTVLELNLGFHSEGLEVHLPDIPSRSFGLEGDSDYQMKLGTYYITGKKIEGKELIRFGTDIRKKYIHSVPGAPFEKVHYSDDENIIIGSILNHFKLRRDPQSHNKIVEPQEGFGFRPHDIKGLHGKLERLNLASSIIDDFLGRNYDVAKTLIEEGLEKYKDKL